MFQFSSEELSCLDSKEKALFEKFASQDNSASYFYSQELTLGYYQHKVKFIRRVKSQKQFQSKILVLSDSQLPQSQHIRQRGCGNYLWMWKIVSSKPIVVKKVRGVSNYPLNVGSLYEGLTVLRAQELPLAGHELQFNNIIRKLLNALEQKAYQGNPIGYGYVRVPTHNMPKRDSDNWVPRDSMARNHKFWQEEYYLIKRKTASFEASMDELDDSYWNLIPEGKVSGSTQGLSYVDKDDYWQESKKITVRNVCYGGLF